VEILGGFGFGLLGNLSFKYFVILDEVISRDVDTEEGMVTSSFDFWGNLDITQRCKWQ